MDIIFTYLFHIALHLNPITLMNNAHVSIKLIESRVIAYTRSEFI